MWGAKVTEDDSWLSGRPLKQNHRPLKQNHRPPKQNQRSHKETKRKPNKDKEYGSKKLMVTKKIFSKECDEEIESDSTMDVKYIGERWRCVLR